MCNDLSFFSNIEVMADYLPELRDGEQFILSFESTYHTSAFAKTGQPQPRWPVITYDGKCYTPRAFEWGLMAPYMAKLDPKEQVRRRQGMVNARSERVLGDKSSVWYRLRNQRVLVAAQGFFEHQDVGQKTKQAWFIKVKDASMFTIAGLYNYSPVADKETGEIPGTFAQLTRKANSIMADIHNSGENKNRMPLILPRHLERRWLKPDLSDEEMEEIMSYEIPSDQLEAWPVDSIRKEKLNTADIIRPIQLQKQSTLFG